MKFSPRPCQYAVATIMKAMRKYSVDFRCNSKHQSHFFKIICQKECYFFFKTFATLCPRCNFSDRESNVATVGHFTIIYTNKCTQLYWIYNNNIQDTNLHVSGLIAPSSGSACECENVEKVEHGYPIPTNKTKCSRNIHSGHF